MWDSASVEPVNHLSPEGRTLRGVVWDSASVGPVNHLSAEGRTLRGCGVG